MWNTTYHKMESERQNSKPIVKCNFRVYLEDEEEEEEETLLMDSWIYLDLESDEELSCARACPFAEKNPYDEDLMNLTKKLGNELKAPHAESFPVVSSPHISQTLQCISSPEDNQSEHYSSKTVPHFQNSDGVKDMNTPRNFGAYKSEKENTNETTYVNVSKAFSSEPPPRDLCRTEISKQYRDADRLEVQNTGETPDSGVSKSFLSVRVDSAADTNETSMHLPDVYSLKVKSALEIPHIHASKSLLHEAVDSVMNPNETCRDSTDVHSVTVENTYETPHTHIFKPFVSDAVDFNKGPFIKTETDRDSERQKIPVSSKAQNRSFCDDETVVVISGDEHSDEDCNIIYLGSYQSSNACDVSKHKKSSLDKNIKCEPQKREHNTYEITTNDDSDSDIMICEEKILPKFTDIFFQPGKVVKSSETSSSYQRPNVIIEKTVYPTSNPNVNNLLQSKPDIVRYRKKRKRTYNFPEISSIDTDSVENISIDNKQNRSKPKNKCVPRFWHKSESDPTIQTRDY